MPTHIIHGLIRHTIRNNHIRKVIITQNNIGKKRNPKTTYDFIASNNNIERKVDIFDGQNNCIRKTISNIYVLVP